MKNQTSMTNLVKIIVLLIAIVCIIASIIIEIPDMRTSFIPIIKLLLQSVGISMFVLVIVMWTLGYYERKDFKREIQEIKNSVFESVFNKLFPEPLFLELKKQVFDQDVVRKDCILDIMLTPYKKDKNLIRVELTARYILSNLSEHNVMDEIIHNIDNVVSCLAPKFNYFDVLDIDDNYREQWEGKQLDQFVEIHEGATLFTKEFKLQPKESLKIRYQYEKLQRVSDQFVWHTYLLVFGFKCSVIVSEGLDLEINSESLYPGGMFSPKSIISEGIKYEWDMSDKVLLPYQGIQLRWFPNAMYERHTGNCNEDD